MRNEKKIGAERVFTDNDLTIKERKIKDKVIEKAKDLKKEGGYWRIGYSKVAETRYRMKRKCFQKKKENRKGE